MIRVKKIAHAVYEMPDVEKQTEYYTEVIGLTVTEKAKDAVYLASTVDHHSVVLRKGSQAKCVRLGFQIAPEDDLGAFEKQVQGHGIKTERRKDPEPSISDVVTFEDPKGTAMEVFKREAFSGQRFPTKGIVPHKLGHVAFFVTDVKHVTRFYCEVLGLRTGPRPPFDFEGYWIYVGDVAAVHVAGQASYEETGRLVDVVKERHGSGSVDHIAFAADNWDELVASFDRHGVKYRATQVPGSDLRQLFVLDPDGIQIEINIRARASG